MPSSRLRSTVKSGLPSSDQSVTTIIAAVMFGVAVLFAGSLPWGFVLAPLNLRAGVSVPWAALPMAAYLWAYWRFIRGDWGSPHSAAMRREYLRAHALPADIWPAALVAGLIGFGALFALIAVMSRLVPLPQSAPIITPPEMPAATVLVLLTMASLVAGVTEEAAFRGYMQTPIEQRYGLPLAILVNGTMFGLLHFPNHPDDVLTMLPYYIAVAAVYGGLTWAANSILPSLVLHVGGDVWSLGRLWMTGRPEWQLSPSQPALIRDTGLDRNFLIASASLIALTGLAVAGYRAVRRMRLAAQG
jgi:membrane protease YdiL (CAAX protease family)